MQNTPTDFIFHGANLYLDQIFWRLGHKKVELETQVDTVSPPSAPFSVTLLVYSYQLADIS